MDQNSGYVSFEYNTNYSEVINNLKSWLNNRISWLNTQINNSYQGTINISSATITLSETSYVYDGTAKRPQVTVESYGKILTEGTHYSLTYSNNTNVGNATVTVTGMGNYYNGSKSASFAIVSASSSSSSTPSSSSATAQSSSSSSTPSSSSSEVGTPIISSPQSLVPSPKETRYYNLKGEPLGTAKPSNPGVYIEKNGKQVSKIVIK
jgi:hypothetical protein